VRDHVRIVHLDACYEFPFDTTRALELAFSRTFAVPSIAQLPASTGEFTDRALQALRRHRSRSPDQHVRRERLRLGRRNPRLRQHLPRQKPRKPASVQAVGLRAPPPAKQTARLHRLRELNVEAALRELAPRPSASPSLPRSRPPRRGRVIAQPSGPGSPDRPRSAPQPPRRSVNRRPPPERRACGCRSPHTITDLLSMTEARSSSAGRTEPYDIHAT
jgi:hypothetical protein